MEILMCLVKRLKKITIKGNCSECGERFETQDVNNDGLCLRCNIDLIGLRFNAKAISGKKGKLSNIGFAECRAIICSKNEEARGD